MTDPTRSPDGGLPPGTRVRLRADPMRIGVVGPRVRGTAPHARLEVTFPDGLRWVPVDQLETVGEGPADPVELLEQGRVAAPEDLQRALIHQRLSGRLAEVIYSLEATDTEFHAYQFKPLLKLLEAPTTGILIADEVGLGKTIEAGLIWTELRARFEQQRLLVLCPAMLREKWQRELRKRFGVEAPIADARELVQRLREARDDPRYTSFALIASLQGVRPPKDWREFEGRPPGPRVALARLLEDSRDAPLVNFLVIDEAHYLRNPGTATAEIGRLFRGVAEYAVLLSATPIHLRSQDLFELLHLADEGTFQNRNDFERLLEANRPLVEARRLLEGRRIDPAEVIDRVDEACRHPLLRGSRQLAEIRRRLADDFDPADPGARVELAERIERASLLGHVVTRTRKREVQEWRVQRRVQALPVPLSPIEKDFYEAVTGAVRAYAAESGAHEGFLLAMPQRQVSSSMPAAYRAWRDRFTPGEWELFEEFGEAAEGEDGAGPLVRELASQVAGLASYEALRRSDSKYQKLREVLERHAAGDPDGKVVVFSTFRATLAYLQERLVEDGFRIHLLHGGTGDQESVLEEFREDRGPAILLSSEVASEGVDLQFCRFLVNYDLPWNPMRVEQRIGRLDRIGQRAAAIGIANLLYEDTIDARIYRRLYQRLRLFETSLGALEEVLGEVVRELTDDLIRNALTPEDEERMIEERALALERRMRQEEMLEEEAAHLVAHGAYVASRIEAARRPSRKIESQDLVEYVDAHLRRKYPSSQLVATEEPLVFEVRLSQPARTDLELFVRRHRVPGRTRLTRSDERGVRCRFENTVVRRHREDAELINQTHPLVRMVAEAMEQEAETLRPAAAIKLEAGRAPAGLAPGDYVFAVQRWELEGLRRLETLAYEGARLDGDPIPLAPDVAEDLVHAAARVGQLWHPDPELCRRAGEVAEALCITRLMERFEARREEFEAENEDRVEVQLRSLEHRLKAQIEKLEQLAATYLERDRRKLVAPTRGRISRLQDRLGSRRAEIEAQRQTRARWDPVAVGIVRLGG